MGNKLTSEEKANLKKIGIINQKQEEYYSVRFLSDVGYFKAEQIEALAKIAKDFGKGEISLTSRLTIEIPFIKEENINKVIDRAKEENLRIGGAGNTVRAIVSCKGTVCKNGMIDTRKLSKEIEDEFLGREVPSKFKIGIFGCMNSYGKAQSNDFAVIPKFNIAMNEMDFLVFLGGRAGRKSRKASPMKKKFKEEDLIRLLDKTIEFFNENAIKKERFAEVIERLGENKVEDEIIKKFKDEI